MFLGSFSTRCASLFASLLCVLIFASVTADPGLAACPNALFTGFAHYLAGCGAFERVTPQFKAGSATNVRALAEDGSRAVSSSTGLFAGNEGGRLSAYYESVRSESGWVTAALDPPSSLFPAQELMDVSADLTRSVWEVRRASESLAAEDIAVREADGSFIDVGPMLPPSSTEGPPAGEAQQFLEGSSLVYAGASPDLSSLFFEIKGLGPLWPGDTTQTNGGARSLYEYVGTHNSAPDLVGVDSEGQLISACGTTLGARVSNGTETSDSYNAVSADGKRVFFTASGHQNGNSCEGESHAPEFNEVYARIGHGAGAQTVAISEPSSADCAVCQTTPATAAGEFQGASRDGSKVFFLTEQELFKGDTGMNLYEYDFANRPGHKVIRVSIGATKPEIQGVARVSEDGSHVYFVAQGILTNGPNAEGDEPSPGGDNLYVFERDGAHPSGAVTFIATLSPFDNESFGGDWGSRDNRPVQATPDGRYLVFQSVADLTSSDSSVQPQVFEYDSARDELVRVSVGEPGYAPGTEAAEAAGGTLSRQEYIQAMSASQPATGLAVSDDGSVVAFVSTGGLTAQTAAAGEAGLPSLFEYRSSGVLSDGQVFSVSDGSGLFAASVAGIDASGSDAFFATVSPTLASDGDTQTDVYDARDGGGFAATQVIPDCETGFSCQGGVPGAPVLAGAGSEGAAGGGNAPSMAPPIASVKPVVLSRAQKLARALKACRKDRRGHRRRVCEVSARRRFGSVKAKGRG